MKITGEHNTDIYLDFNGYPIADETGSQKLVQHDECWLQDIRLEAQTEEYELFYEDEDGRDCYGWSLLDFVQAEYDEFTEIEIRQRIKTKLSKRKFIDARSIKTIIAFDGERYHALVKFARNDSKAEYNLDITIDKVEVVVI